MEAKVIVGYHMTTKENAYKILDEGFKPSKMQYNHWLGKGIYFFDDVYYATEWGIIGVQRQEMYDYQEYLNKCQILASTIDIDNYTMIDLSSPIGYRLFLDMLEILKTNYSENEYDNMFNKGYRYIVRLLENIEKENGILCLSAFDVVCAIYPKKIYREITNKKQSDFMVCAQKQICVKNKKAILNTELYISENQHSMFDILIRNRGEKNER